MTSMNAIRLQALCPTECFVNARRQPSCTSSILVTAKKGIIPTQGRLVLGDALQIELSTGHGAHKTATRT